MLVNNNISSVSFCDHINSQSGVIWHSHNFSYLPLSLWGEYSMGRVPVFSKSSDTFSNNEISYPLFWHSFKSFLNLCV